MGEYESAEVPDCSGDDCVCSGAELVGCSVYEVSGYYSV